MQSLGKGVRKQVLDGLAARGLLRAAHKVVDPDAHGVDRKTIKNRAKEIREGAWAAGAVVKAIEAIQAAVTTVIIMSSVTDAPASGGS